jgi:hypothetical protein
MANLVNEVEFQKRDQIRPNTISKAGHRRKEQITDSLSLAMVMGNELSNGIPRRGRGETILS